MTRVARVLVTYSLLMIGDVSDANDALIAKFESAQEAVLLFESLTSESYDLSNPSLPGGGIPALTVVDDIDWASISSVKELLDALDPRLKALAKIRADAEVAYALSVNELFKDKGKSVRTQSMINAFELISRADAGMRDDNKHRNLDSKDLWYELLRTDVLPRFRAQLESNPDSVPESIRPMIEALLPNDAPDFNKEELRRLVTEVRRLISVGVYSKLCISGGMDGSINCDDLGYTKESIVEDMVVALKSDLALSREILHAAYTALPANEQETVKKGCGDIENWLKFDLRCMEFVKKSFGRTESSPAALERVFDVLLGMPVREAIEDAVKQQVKCTREVTLRNKAKGRPEDKETITCDGSTALNALAGELGINPEDVFDPRYRTDIEALYASRRELLKLLAKLEANIEAKSIVIAEALDRSLELHVRVDGAEAMDEVNFSVPLLLREKHVKLVPPPKGRGEEPDTADDAADNPPTIRVDVYSETGVSLIASGRWPIVPDSWAVLASLAEDEHLTLEWQIDETVATKWLTRYLPPTLAKALNAGVLEADLGKGSLRWPEPDLEVRLPWAAATNPPQSGTVCHITWAMVSGDTPSGDCVDTAIKSYGMLAITSALEHASDLSLVGNAYVSRFRDDLINAVDLDTLSSIDSEGISFSVGEGAAAVLLRIDRSGKAVLVPQGGEFEKEAMSLLLQSIPYLVFEHDEDRDRYNVYWQPPGEAPAKIARAIVDDNDVTFVLSNPRPTIAIPGFGDVTLKTLDVALATGRVTVTASSIAIADGLTLPSISLTLGDEGVVSIDVPETDRAEARLWIGKVVNKIGLMSARVEDVDWDDKELALVASIKLDDDSVEKILLDDRWSRSIQTLLENVAARRGQAELDALLSQYADQERPLELSIADIRLKRECSIEGTPRQCQVIASIAIDDSGNRCTLYEWTFDETGKTLSGAGRECLQSWLESRWIGSGSLSIGNEDIRYQAEAKLVTVPFVLQVDEALFESSVILDLRSGSAQFQDDLESRVRAYVEAGVFSAAGLDQGLEKLGEEMAAMCASLAGQLSQAPVTTKISIDGQPLGSPPDCTKVNWSKSQQNINSTYRLDLDVAIEGLANTIPIHNATLTPTDGLIRFDGVDKAQVATAMKAAIEPIVTSKLREDFDPAVSIATNGIEVTATIPIRLLPGTSTYRTRFGLTITKDGARTTIDDGVREALFEEIAEFSKKHLTGARIGTDGFSVVVKNVVPNPGCGGNDYCLNFEAEGRVGNNTQMATFILSLATGDLEPPDVEEIITKELVEKAIAAFEADNPLKSWVTTGKPNWSADCTGGSTGCHATVPVFVNLNALGEIHVGELKIWGDRPWQFDGPDSITVPLPSPLPMPPVSLANNSASFQGDTVTITSDVAVQDTESVLAIDSSLSLNRQNKEITLRGNGQLFGSVPLGGVEGRMGDDYLTVGVALGGALKRLIRLDGCLYLNKNLCDELQLEDLDTKCADDPEAFAQACGEARLFDLDQLSDRFDMRIGKDGSAKATSEFNFVIFKKESDFAAGSKFSNPILNTRDQLKIGNIEAVNINLQVSMSGAAFKVRALGITAGLVLQNLAKMDKSDIEKMILALLMPDIDLDEMLKAILAGNLTINPFSSFGEGGGDSSGDGGDGGSGGAAGGDGTGGKLIADNRAAAVSGDRKKQSISDFAETDKGKGTLASIIEVDYPWPKDLPAPTANYDLIQPGGAVVAVEQASEGQWKILKKEGSESWELAVTSPKPSNYEIIRAGKLAPSPTLGLLFDLSPSFFRGLARADTKDAAVVVINVNRDNKLYDIPLNTTLKYPATLLKKQYLGSSPMSVAGQTFRAVVKSWESCLETATAPEECKSVDVTTADYAGGTVILRETYGDQRIKGFIANPNSIDEQFINPIVVSTMTMGSHSKCATSSRMRELADAGIQQVYSVGSNKKELVLVPSTSRNPDLYDAVWDCQVQSRTAVLENAARSMFERAVSHIDAGATEQFLDDLADTEQRYGGKLRLLAFNNKMHAFSNGDQIMFRVNSSIKDCDRKLNKKALREVAEWKGELTGKSAGTEAARAACADPKNELACAGAILDGIYGLDDNHRVFLRGGGEEKRICQ